MRLSREVSLPARGTILPHNQEVNPEASNLYEHEHFLILVFAFGV